MCILVLRVDSATPLPDLDPRLKGAWPPYGRATAKEVVAGNDHAFLAAGEAGLLVFNVSNPSQPRHVGTLSISGFASGIAISSDYVFVANRGMGYGTNRTQGQPIPWFAKPMSSVASFRCLGLALTFFVLFRIVILVHNPLTVFLTP